MPRKNDSPLRGFRRSGSFQYENQAIDVLINPKTGQLLFQENGRPVEEEARQNALMDYFQQINRHPGH